MGETMGETIMEHVENNSRGAIVSDNQREAGTIILDPTHASFAPDEGVNDLGATHFIGIGGAGMSVLAEMLHEQGVEVDGSDREPSACCPTA